MNGKHKKICVMGLGYIGLPTASLLATKGFHVVGVDVDDQKMEALQKGEVPIHEPDLDVLVKSALQSGNFKAQNQPEKSDIFIIAVPTPFKEDFEPDLSFIEAATQTIAPCLEAGNLVILESTSPVQTTEKIASWLKSLRPDLEVPTDWHFKHKRQIYIAHCPERVLPGQILKELVDNDRVVGGMDENSARIAQEFYESFVNGKVLVTNSRTAELTKLVENAYRDVNIAFANELSLICDRLNINVWELINLANHHPRVNILKPGPGVGGHCIAVDPWFIVSSAPEESKLIRQARKVNDAKPHHVVEKIVKHAERLKQPVIACLGLTFKADVDDLRESPAMEIVKELAQKKIGKLLVVEPHVRELPLSLSIYDHVGFVEFKTALKEADMIVLLVDHRQFKHVDRSLIQEKMVIDTRGMWR